MSSRKELPSGYRWDDNKSAKNNVFDHATEWRLVRESDGKVIHWIEKCDGYHDVIWTHGLPRDAYDTLEHAQEAVRKNLVKRIADERISNE